MSIPLVILEIHQTLPITWKRITLALIYKVFKEGQQTGEQNSNNSSSSSHSLASWQKILQFPYILNLLPHFSIRHKELVSAVTEFVCQDVQPFSAVEGIEFCKLIHSLELRFQVPSRNYLSRKEIPCQYNLKSKLLSITTDIGQLHIKIVLISVIL